MSTETLDELGSIFVDPEAYADPERWHRAARRIREESPVLRVSLPGYPDFWAVTRHADVMTAERNPDVFTNWPAPTLGTLEQMSMMTSAPVKTLVQMDGDEHRAHRAVVSDWFKPGNLKKLQGRIDELAARYVDRMASLGGECDFVTDVALHYPLQVILSLLGLPGSDYDRMLTLTQELFGAEDPDVGRAAEDGAALATLMDMVSYFTQLAESRRAAPTDDLASVIANARIDGEPLPELDMLGHYVIIATAGHDTTSSAIAGGLLALIENPDQLRLLRERPELIDNAADEIVRWVSPVKHFARTCQRQFTLGGVEVQAGDLLCLSYQSANRDAEVFADPMRFDVARTDAAEHLAFGFGRHFCLGAHLARMEIRAIFRRLVPRLEHVELAAEPQWVKAYFVSGPKSIPIRYELR